MGSTPMPHTISDGPGGFLGYQQVPLPWVMKYKQLYVLDWRQKVLRDLIVNLFPFYYERYIEVFGVGGWVLFHKNPGYRTIATQLNDEKIIPPREYYYNSIGKPNPKKGLRSWSDVVVREILKNEAYIGNIVQMRKAHSPTKHAYICCGYS